eukprot:8065067-Pyramimonas_sp.AAC.1
MSGVSGRFLLSGGGPLSPKTGGSPRVRRRSFGASGYGEDASGLMSPEERDEARGTLNVPPLGWPFCLARMDESPAQARFNA